MALDVPFADLIALNSQRFGVEEELIAAIIHWESGFDPNIVGDRGHSVGLMQLHDEGAGAGLTVAQRKDPAINIEVGTRYLRGCLDAFPGDLRTGISAYNQGIGGARQRGWQYTAGYVNGIISLYNMYKGAIVEVPWTPPAPPGYAPGCAGQAGGIAGAIIFAGGIFYAVCRCLFAR